MPAKKISISLYPPEIFSQVERRVTGDGRAIGQIGLSGVISRDLARYYALLTQAFEKFCVGLTHDEIAEMYALLRDRCWQQSPAMIALIIRDIAGSATPSLTAKIQQATTLELCALADAVERFRQAADADPRRALDCTGPR